MYFLTISFYKYEITHQPFIRQTLKLLPPRATPGICLLSLMTSYLWLLADVLFYGIILFFDHLDQSVGIVTNDPVYSEIE